MGSARQDHDRERSWGSDMRAVVIEEFGPPEVLVPREVRDPKLGHGDALIEVEFANVTFVETQVRRGRPPRPSMLPQLPAILGNGVGGTVVAVGAELDGALVGARVLASTGGRGGYAELASAPATSIISIPAEIAMSDAVALLADGRTALGLIDAAVVQPGETVLRRGRCRRCRLALGPARQACRSARSRRCRGRAQA
jgi:NADPH2:quinone reductase